MKNRVILTTSVAVPLAELGGRRKGHFQGRSKLAEAALADGKLANNRAAGGVRQGMEDAVKLGGSIHNHMV